MRKRKAFGAVLIWALLSVLVLLYTDRDAFTWRYTSADMAMILETRAQAEAAQRASDEAYALETQQAAQRQAEGVWGGNVQYGGAKETLNARDEYPGLNLMWGGYEVALEYQSPAPFEVGVVSAGRQAFIRGGAMPLEAAPEGARADFTFTLTDSTERVMLACDLPEGAKITAVTVHKQGTGVFSADLAAYALIAGGVMTWLYLLMFDESADGRKRRRDAMALVCTAAFASLPALMEHIVDGHDLFFHMNRIEGIAAGLRSGQFPVRIHASTLLGFGYAASEFYPEAFLYVPALLRNMGVSLMASVQVMMILINLATALVCYGSVRAMTRSRDVALLSSILYTLSIYRLVSLYAVATIAEALAMVFFPMLIYAVTQALVGDSRCWPVLSLAMTGIFMSHLLSTLLAAGFCVLAALVCVRRLLREPVRIVRCALAAGLMALCSMGFLVPFLLYSAAGINTNVTLPAYRYRLTIGELMLGFSEATGDAHSVGRALGGTIGAHPGLAILLGCALLMTALYMQGMRREESDRLPCALLGFGVTALLCSTALFPWEALCALARPFSTIVMQVQYPRRLLGVATPLLSVAAAYGYLRSERRRTAFAALAVGLCVVFAGYFMGDFVRQEPILDREGYCDTRVRQYEYTYMGTEKDLLEPGKVVFGEAEQPADLERNGVSMTIRLAPGSEGAYMEAPLLYYPGYQATVNDQPCKVVRGDNNVIRLYGPFTAQGDTVRIWYEEPVLWRAAEGAALLGFALLAGMLVRRRKGAA